MDEIQRKPKRTINNSDENLIGASISIPEKHNTALEIIANKRGSSRSDLIRQIIAKWYNNRYPNNYLTRGVIPATHNADEPLAMSIILQPEIATLLDFLAEHNGTSRTQLIRDLILDAAPYRVEFRDRPAPEVNLTIDPKEARANEVFRRLKEKYPHIAALSLDKQVKHRMEIVAEMRAENWQPNL